MPKTVTASRPKSSPAEPRSLAKSWCLTINEPTESDAPDISKGVDSPFLYAVFGMEKAPTTGTRHIQAYVVYHKRVRFPTVKRDFPRAHIEVAKGTPQQNYDYCTKDGDFYEIGTLPPSKGVAGGRAQIDRYAAALESARAGKLEDIPADLYTRHRSTYKAVMEEARPPPEDAESTTGVWIYGPTGVGKSRHARTEYAPFYSKPVNKWWDDYADEPNVIIEDIDPSHSWLGYHLKIWTDRYTFRAESKGSSKMIRPATVVVTSQYSIEQVFPNDKETVDALRRRMRVVHMPSGPLPDAVRAMSAV